MCGKDFERMGRLSAPQTNLTRDANAADVEALLADTTPKRAKSGLAEKQASR